MPKHPDAIGYLKDLATDICKPWFTMVSDLAAISGKSTLDQHDFDTICALFLKRASYLGIKSYPPAAAPVVTAHEVDFLEELSGFSNFKLLKNTLRINFTKRITLVFGANSSGKSSLCESLKVLANPEVPSRPLHNVRVTGTVPPEFSYKFKSDATAQTWTQTTGYGPRRANVKYFDAGIALKNVKGSVEPGRVVELTPFKLYVFERAKVLTSEFRAALQNDQQNNETQLTQALGEVKTAFAKFTGRPLASINGKPLAGLFEEIKVGEAFNQNQLLKEKQSAAVELEKAASEEGLKLLKVEHRDLEAFLTSLGTLLDSADGLWSLEPVTKAKDLDTKQTAQELLAKELIPENGTLEGLLSLLRAASPLCNLENAAHHPCPLCRRELGESEADLFKRYHELLAGELEKEIIILHNDLKKATDFVKAVGVVNRKEWDKFNMLPAEMLAEAKDGSALIIGSCDLAKDPTVEAKAALVSLRALCTKGTQLMEQKGKAIEAAATGRDEVVKQLEKVRVEIAPLEYAHLIAESLETLRAVRRMADEDVFWNAKLPTFTPLLKKITDAAKKAHEDLVVSDFESRLNAEYRALTEKDMTAFGVKLKNIGGDAAVTVSPHIGGKDIEGVLSEGEQRVHALALFFAELETCLESVLVFDDPISSFDYNYIANYCTRLRDFALSHPNRQIIVLTHNWEFFVQLQTTLNTGGLHNSLSVQVLENCAVVADYSEKTDELKANITTILSLPGEPTNDQKEEMAGKMRRLIEAVVNTHVFNNQRHQYKQKSQPVAEFHHFTKLVPLLSTEATTLRDLYAKLSIPEHDDPRNAYVNTDKATFKALYDNIIGVETAVISRR